MKSLTDVLEPHIRDKSIESLNISDIEYALQEEFEIIRMDLSNAGIINKIICNSKGENISPRNVASLFFFKYTEKRLAKKGFAEGEIDTFANMREDYLSYLSSESDVRREDLLETMAQFTRYGKGREFLVEVSNCIKHITKNLPEVSTDFDIVGHSGGMAHVYGQVLTPMKELLFQAEGLMDSKKKSMDRRRVMAISNLPPLGFEELTWSTIKKVYTAAKEIRKRDRFDDYSLELSLYLQNVSHILIHSEDDSNLIERVGEAKEILKLSRNFYEAHSLVVDKLKGDYTLKIGTKAELQELRDKFLSSTKQAVSEIEDIGNGHFEKIAEFINTYHDTICQSTTSLS